ncbi:EAL domain-containing protein [Marinicella sp. S1101]|uniref:EAL domain-containing protein n=1 Tax=Marinicella marina TaxID=2996016 RepID=UPI002260D8AB|nr:EAL domain-containing protein [Marinicella marina]MCX7554791.1 EAL domain-containing protein [Marinicella marina]MDJ1140976.1 EAL domain-containing protein [Marinicella marina]
MSYDIKKYQQGEIVFHGGDSSDCAYIIEQGQVEIFVASNQTIIDILNEGELFGEMGVLDQSPRSTSARALTPLTLIEVKTQQITNRLSESDPIVKALVGVLLKRFRSMLPNQGMVSKNSLLDQVASVIEQAGLSKFKLESELRGAIVEGEVQTVFQPISNISSQKIAGFEALSRWTHHERGFISPVEFIALAEETDLIIEVGDLVFTRAIELLERLPEHVFININVSSKQLDDDEFLNRVKAKAKAHAINPSRLKLEITETMVVDFKLAKKWLDKCRAIGFPVCADDFGTGHSGMEQLLELDFDVLKVDQVFIRNMFKSKRYEIILQSIAQMAQALETKLVAEGIESDEEFQMLKKLGFDFGQGYFFGKPMSEENALKLSF